MADLGLDKILIYRLDAAKGKLAPNDPPWTRLAPGSGPRHFAFHPAGRYAYVINELGSTVTALRYDPGRGTLAALQTVSTLPARFDGRNSTAEVQVHPSGRSGKRCLPPFPSKMPRCEILPFRQVLGNYSGPACI